MARVKKEEEDGGSAVSAKKAKKSSSSSSNNSVELRCEMCDIACTGIDAYNAHMSGKQHNRTLRLHIQLGKPIPAPNPVALSTAKSNGCTFAPPPPRVLLCLVRSDERSS